MIRTFLNHCLKSHLNIMLDLLSNHDLINYCKLFNIKLNNVLNKDLFQQEKPRLGNYIVNLEDSYDGPGTHWAAFIITEDLVIYFDSYGMPVPQDIKNFVRRYKKKDTYHLFIRSNTNIEISIVRLVCIILFNLV